MQDTQAIAGEGGRLFAGGSGAGDSRRLRPAQHSHHHQQALKCPRCESLNTKFCYYNNYNLSQPRYFCKGCRRYWTKGGVLRNVPVGGGCRKTKRSSKPKNTAPSSSDLTPDPNSNSHSSSESSSLTATTTASKKASASITTATAGSSAEVGSASASKLLNFSSDSRYILDQPQPLIDPIGTSEGQIFSEMRSFTSLMTSSNDPGMLSFSTSMADIPGFGLQPSGQDQQNPTQLLGGGELKTEEQISCGGYLDQTGELSGLDWQMNDGGSGGEHGLFDFTGAVDQTYWGQNQWSDHDHDHSLNFPPLV